MDCRKFISAFLFIILLPDVSFAYHGTVDIIEFKGCIEGKKECVFVKEVTGHVEPQYKYKELIIAELGRPIRVRRYGVLTGDETAEELKQPKDSSPYADTLTEEEFKKRLGEMKLLPGIAPSEKYASCGKGFYSFSPNKWIRFDADSVLEGFSKELDQFEYNVYRRIYYSYENDLDKIILKETELARASYGLGEEVPKEAFLTPDRSTIILSIKVRTYDQAFRVYFIDNASMELLATFQSDWV